MNHLRRTLTAAVAVAAIAAGAACQPKPPPKPNCGPYSVVQEGKPLPCTPTRGVRIDYVMSGPVTPSTPATVRDAAVARCNAMGGQAFWQDRILGNVASRVLVCRTVGS